MRSRDLCLFHLAVGLVACSGETAPDGDSPGSAACPETPGTICNWAGTGQAGFFGEGVDRRDAWLYFPMDIVFSPYGDPVLADWNNHKLRLIREDDTITTIMGTDFLGDGDPQRLDATVKGAPGLDVNLNHPTQQRYFTDGTLLSASWHTHKLRTWDPATGITHVYLGSLPEFNGDNWEDASEALLNQPSQVEIDAAQNVYIVDMRNERVRVLDTAQWTINTLAGNGDKDYCGEGGPARDACLSFPKTANPEPGGSIAFSPDQSELYVADTENHVIRVVDLATLTIELYAGAPATPDDVDGDRLAARFRFPRDLEMSPDGILYVADSDNNKVRAIDTGTGQVTTVVGTGEPSCAEDGRPQNVPRTCEAQKTGGDGGSALDATLYRPFAVALDLDGNLVVSDTFDHRLRIVYR